MASFSWWDIYSELLAQEAMQQGINFKDRGENTALHVAKSAETCKSLIDARADVHAQNYVACTPLHYAATGGHAEVTKALVAAGADVNTKNWHGATALHESKNVDVLKVLIEARADVHATDHHSHIAVDRVKRRSRQAAAYIQNLMTIPVVLTIEKSHETIVATNLSGKISGLVPVSEGLTLRHLKCALKREIGYAPAQVVQDVTSEGNLLSDVFDSVIIHPDINFDRLQVPETNMEEID